MNSTLRLVSGAVALALAVLLPPGPARAEGPRTYAVGDRVEADPMLLGQWRKATVVKVHRAEGRVNGYEVRMDADGDDAVKEEYTVGTTVERGIRPLAEPAAPAREKARRPSAQNVPPGSHTETAPATSCSSDPALTAAPAAGDSRTLAFERAILHGYQRLVEEKSSLSAPLSVGVTFDSFQIGEPRTNERTLDRTDGSYIRSAPVGASIYPVKTRFTNCQAFAREITRTSVDGRYECFKDTFGEWSCANASGWRTLETRREPFDRP